MTGSMVRRWGALCAAVLAVMAGGQEAVAQPAAGLTAFRSDAELRRFLESQWTPHAQLNSPISVDTVDEVVVVGARASVPSITNTQVPGVDEGGLVKVHGDTLVVLRRGRLFTVSTGGGELKPVDSINAFPPGIDGEDAWYDEMLVSRDRVIVIGYSYEADATEINRFRISPDGKLTYEDTHHLSSGDYFSSSNYASRLIGDTLIFYTPLRLRWEHDPMEALPAMRRWVGSDAGEFKRIVQARNLYRPPNAAQAAGKSDTLHTVTQCDVAAPVMTCKATAVVGSRARSFYVSGEAVYLWVGDWWAMNRSSETMLYRVPLNGSRPQAIQIRGAPLSQFAFHEDEDKGVLNVALHFWNEEAARGWSGFSDGRVAMLSLPLDRFGNGAAAAPKTDYRLLVEDVDTRRHRFVGNHFLWGGDGTEEGDAENTGMFAVTSLQTDETQVFRTLQPVSRIEVLGRDALVVGSDKDLVFTTVTLTGRPRLSDTFTLRGVGESESRSHGFFYRPDGADGVTGVLGLPMIVSRPEASHSVNMAFLRRQNGQIGSLGELQARPASEDDDEDGCIASCVDWYGNARPIFLRDRIFALLGYELVEGREAAGRITEVRRANFSPPPSQKPKG